MFIFDLDVDLWFSCLSLVYLFI